MFLGDSTWYKKGEKITQNLNNDTSKEILKTFSSKVMENQYISSWKVIVNK